MLITLITGFFSSTIISCRLFMMYESLALPPANVCDGADRFLENADQQADGVEVVEDVYPAIVQAAAEPSPAA